MEFKTYSELFQTILKAENQQDPYTDAEYFNYTKLNWSRLSRWTKTGVVFDEFAEKIKAIKSRQNWIVITEPWCGDAAHIVPMIKLMADLNPNINLTFELRDQEPFRINSYLTNGSKSIPVLIIQDEDGKDLAVWSSRPKKCQDFFNEMKAKGVEMSVMKTELQNWYNENKGYEIQKEISALV